MSKEAMRLALEAAYLAGFNASGEGYNGEYPFGDKNQNPEADAVWVKDRDNTIREALAEQPAQKRPQNCGTGYCSCIECVMEPSQQEPVACIGYWNQKTGAYYKPDQISASHQKLIEDGILRRCYTTPPQRTWVGLTESEITTSPTYSVTRDKGCFHAGALWAEAKLKEKNT